MQGLPIDFRCCISVKRRVHTGIERLWVFITVVVVEGGAIVIEITNHAWQHMKGLYLEEAEQKLDSNHIKEYLRRPSEKDAYAFQETQMNKHALMICNILGIQSEGFNYTCNIDAILRSIKHGKK
ncbi:MAG: hypothetical protein P0Y55_17730 [Candidatus Cohnella colombiensis]|uniref:Uncharacterized protein n=1 Tax=Candidatus Cohnella colombiensis TaxID=3121368 RepID=A0AA95F3X0_9BACL|nr:MAG: hypothetical protein P0Y55_17730 [Cohnella sp.]